MECGCVQAVLTRHPDGCGTEPSWCQRTGGAQPRRSHRVDEWFAVDETVQLCAMLIAEHAHCARRAGERRTLSSHAQRGHDRKLPPIGAAPAATRSSGDNDFGSAGLAHLLCQPQRFLDEGLDDL